MGVISITDLRVGHVYAELVAWQDGSARGLGSPDVRSILKSVALLCLVLTFWSALAFTAHHHSNAIESAKCRVCVAAHSASPQVTSTPRPATFIAVFTLRAEPVPAKQRFVAFALSVRPPPEV